MKKLKKIVFSSLLISSLSVAPLTATQASGVEEAGYITGSVFSSLLYSPIKLASAAILGVTGGLSLMGTVPTETEEHSVNIVKLGMSGDWWVSPEHLRGNDSLRFMEEPN